MSGLYYICVCSVCCPQYIELGSIHKSSTALTSDPAPSTFPRSRWSMLVWKQMKRSIPTATILNKSSSLYQYQRFHWPNLRSFGLPRCILSQKSICHSDKATHRTSQLCRISRLMWHADWQAKLSEDLYIINYVYVMCGTEALGCTSYQLEWYIIILLNDKQLSRSFKISSIVVQYIHKLKKSELSRASDIPNMFQTTNPFLKSRPVDYHDNSPLCSPVIDLTTEHPPFFDWILLKMEHLCMSLIFKSVDGTCAKNMLKHAVFVLCQHNFLKLLSQVKLLSSKSFRKRRTWRGRVVEVQGSRHMQHIPACFGSFNVASKMLMFWFIHVYSSPLIWQKAKPPKNIHAGYIRRLNMETPRSSKVEKPRSCHT